MKTNKLDLRNLAIQIFLLFLVILGSCSKLKEYRFIIIDDQSGHKSPARFSITDYCGIPININGNPSKVDYLGKQWYYTDGYFSFLSSEDGFTVEVQRGPETVPMRLKIEKGTHEQEIRLVRWTDMNKKGYLNGDIHIHTPFKESALLQMKAEDLDILNILIGEDSIKNKQFTGSMDQVSVPGHIIYVAQEVRDWQMGHLTLLGLKTLVKGYPIVGGTLESYIHTNWLMTHAADETHKQGGLVAWSHFSNLPGSESPVAIALGRIDALELMTYDDPTQLPSHWGPWKNSGMPITEFPVLRGMDLWYQYLNSGFQLPVVAGTDKMADDIPMGSNRFYAYTGGDTTYSSWLSAIKSGRGFITNGPILDFKVGDKIPGDVIIFPDKIKVYATVTAQSILPFATLEIIMNGMVAAHKTIFVSDNPPVNGIYSMKVEANIDIDRSCWIAARIADDPDIKNRILPRGLSVFAHTNPVYFLKQGKSVRDESSIIYLQKYVKGTINWLKTGPPFDNPSDRYEALKLAEEAYKVYESLKSR